MILEFIRSLFVKRSNFSAKPMDVKRSSHWPVIRKDHLEKQSFCQACGGKAALEVHHDVAWWYKKDLVQEKTMGENMSVEIHVFIPSGYDGIGGVFMSLGEALKAAIPNSSSFENVDEYIVGQSGRIRSYLPDGTKWSEDGKRCFPT